MSAAEMQGIAVAMPKAEPQRALLRRIAGMPLPAIVPGSKDLPCVNCGMVLAVGPRIQALVEGGIRLYCIVCAKARSEALGAELIIQDMGNPDSKWEGT